MMCVTCGDLFGGPVGARAHKEVYPTHEIPNLHLDDYKPRRSMDACDYSRCRVNASGYCSLCHDGLPGVG